MEDQSPPTNGTNASPNPVELEDVRSPARLISQFFLFPLLIVVIGIAIFVLFGLIGSENKSAKDYLRELRTTQGMFQGNRRWQAACELSVILAKNQDPRLGPAIAPELIQLFNNSPKDDPRVRRYLVLALGRLGDPSAVPVLVRAIRDEDAETRVYAIYALGELGAQASVPDLIALYNTDDAGLRKIIVYVFGVLQDARALPTLKLALEDRQVDVQWNAALALARLHDASGLPMLRHVLDRQYLNTVKEMRDDQKEEVMVNAIKALSLLRDRASQPLLKTLSGRDPSLKVRDAAFEALRVIS